ncbi:hypothetical protein [Robertkochia flava]|uniref:hypothetical protein n=1 Tax=Robertkochia flava TaxID=3447986 RepID=UPI001CCE073E|nr:hypothetical protein [Robertkochia marina]
MKNIFNLILTIVLAWVITLFTPWWGVMLAALIVSFLVPLKGGSTFFVPYLAIFSLWGIQAYMAGSANDFILAGKIADLFSLDGNTTLLILVTATIGGLAAAFAGLLGKQLKTVVTS